jgi:hypothetical protein
MAQCILNLGTRGRWVVSYTPRPVYPRGKSLRYALDRGLSGLQSRSGRGGEEKTCHHCPWQELNPGRQSVAGPNILNIPSPCYCLSVRNKVSHPYRTQPRLITVKCMKFASYWKIRQQSTEYDSVLYFVCVYFRLIPNPPACNIPLCVSLYGPMLSPNLSASPAQDFENAAVSACCPVPLSGVEQHSYRCINLTEALMVFPLCPEINLPVCWSHRFPSISNLQTLHNSVRRDSLLGFYWELCVEVNTITCERKCFNLWRLPFGNLVRYSSGETKIDIKFTPLMSVEFSNGWDQHVECLIHDWLTS